MPDFPKREADLLSLAAGMIAGYADEPSLFPHADAVGLQARLDDLHACLDGQTKAQALAQMATKEKKASLKRLEAFVKVQLRQSEVDAAVDPKTLALIGWGPKAGSRAADPPGQPRGLTIAQEDGGALTLVWKAPPSGDGGRVRTYIIERREQSAAGGPLGEWRHAGVSLLPRITLTNQPRGLQLEYRVHALNHGGPGEPGNAVAVVL